MFLEYVVPYLQDREVGMVAFMNVGFWRTEQF